MFPKTKNQLCIVHQIRNSCKFVPYKDRKAVCADLKEIYGAVIKMVRVTVYEDKRMVFTFRDGTQVTVKKEAWEAA